MLTEFAIHRYLEEIASGNPTPGGGSACALAAATGAALAGMIAGLTTGRKAFAAVESEITEIQSTAAALREQMIVNVNRDAQAYDQVLAALRMPKQTSRERTQRTDALQAAYRFATRVPLDVAKSGLAVMAVCERAMTVGNPKATTDGLVGTVLARSAVLGAVHNIRINLTCIDDPAFVHASQAKADMYERRAKELEVEILAKHGSS